METVTLPRGFVEELYEYFYTQLPMKQAEPAVVELRKALAGPQEQVQRPDNLAGRLGLEAALQES